MKYYIAENGQPAGPFEPSELMQHGLTVNSLVWCEGMANWTSASQVPELMAVLSGQPFNPGNINTQLPPVGQGQMPPTGQTQLPQIPPFGGGQTQPTTTGQPYNQPMPNQPYAPPQYGPSNNQTTNNVMPKTWLMESILVTAASLLCCFNIFGIITGVLAIFKANSVKSKFTQGDVTGANSASASAKKWMLITVAIGVIWTIVQAVRMMSDPSFLQQIQEGAVGNLYGM